MLWSLENSVRELEATFTLNPVKKQGLKTDKKGY